MRLFKEAARLQQCLSEKDRISFVPTMGALHKGHRSLIEEAKKSGGFVICSIFVNPAQFNDKKDFEKYPVTIEEDILMLHDAGCDCLFLPSVAEVYPGGMPANEHYDLGYLENILEGFYRPGHFQGVCMVMKRLLDMVKPDMLFLGQKDYQQCMVIKKLIELMGMEKEIAIKIVPTLREKNGLAMSSRNRRLTESGKERAAMLYEILLSVKKQLQPGDLTSLKQQNIKKLNEAGFKTDYIEIADAGTLQIAAEWDGSKKLVALVAAFLEEVRLIDNMVLN